MEDNVCNACDGPNPSAPPAAEAGGGGSDGEGSDGGGGGDGEGSDGGGGGGGGDSGAEDEYGPGNLPAWAKAAAAGGMPLGGMPFIHSAADRPTRSGELQLDAAFKALRRSAQLAR